LQKQLQSQARTLNDDSRAALAKSIDSKTTEVQRATDDAQKEFGAMQNEILARIGNKIGPLVQQYAKENNFTLIVDSSNQNSQLIYADPGIDITDDIIKRVDTAIGACCCSTSCNQKIDVFMLGTSGAIVRSETDPLLICEPMCLVLPSLWLRSSRVSHGTETSQRSLSAPMK